MAFCGMYILPKYHYIYIDFAKLYKCDIISISVILLELQIGIVENLSKKNMIEYDIPLSTS